MSLPAAEEPLPSSDGRKPRLFYGYNIVAACFVVLVVIQGIFNAFGVFFGPLQTSFSASRAAISAATSVEFVVMGFGAVAWGFLSDRFSPRLTLSIGALIYGIGYMLASRVSSIWQLYLVFGFIGIGYSASDVVPLSLVARWFVRKRGAMSGLAKVGTGLGQTVMPLVAGLLIAKFQWQMAFFILGVLVLVVVVPVAQSLRRGPAEMGLLPDGDSPSPDGRAYEETGLRFHQAFRTRQFWVVCGFYAALLFSSQSILTHVVRYALDIDAGISNARAAGLISVFGAASIAGRLLMGFGSDRIGRKRSMVISFIVMVVALVILQFSRQLLILYVFAAVYGFNHGGFFAQISPVISWLFGTRAQGALLGAVVFFGNLAGAVGPLVTGRIYDVTGSYAWAFALLLLDGALGLILVSMLKPMPEGVRNGA